MSGSATPATQNNIETCLETAKRRGFAASPIDTVTLQERDMLEPQNERFVRDVLKYLKNSHFVDTKPPFSYSIFITCWLRTVATRLANTPSTPKPPE